MIGHIPSCFIRQAKQHSLSGVVAASWRHLY